MLYKIANPKLVQREINKLRPLNYNMFYWWRRYDRPTKQLPKNATFLERIQNGEFEFSHLYWQAQHCEMEINQKHQEYGGDIQKLLENDAVAFERRKRLWDDFNKTEANIMKELKKNFMAHFEISHDEYDDVILNFDGTTEELYYHMRRSFEHRPKPLKKRGRPSKKK